MLKALFMVRLLAMKSWLTGASRKKQRQRRGSLVGFACLMTVSLFALGFTFWQIFDALATPFHEAGLDWLYFAIVSLTSFALMFIGNIFAAKAQLYEARDNDLLMSLPVKPGYILLSRMFMLWVIVFVLGLLVALPAMIVWIAAADFGTAALLWYIIIFFLLLPLLALTLSAIFGWLLSLISARISNKSLFTVVFSLIFMGAYMYFVSRMNSILSGLAMNPDSSADTFGAVLFLRWVGAACALGDTASGLKLAAVIIVSFAAVCYILAKTFHHTASGTHGIRKKYVAGREKLRTPRSALLWRELRRLLASPAYLLNCGLGVIMAPVAAIVLLIKWKDLSAMPDFAAIQPLLQLLFIAGLCFFTSTCLFTAPAVSLEGRSLWIVRSMPVDTREILRAKLRLHCLLTLPSMLISSIIVALVTGAKGITLLCMLLFPGEFCVFVGLFGLMQSLRHPNLDWINETQAVKSGMAVMITMFVSAGLVLACAGAVVLLSGFISPELCCLALALLLAALCPLLYRRIMTKGVDLFEAL